MCLSCFLDIENMLCGHNLLDETPFKPGLVGYSLTVLRLDYLDVSGGSDGN